MGNCEEEPGFLHFCAFVSEEVLRETYYWRENKACDSFDFYKRSDNLYILKLDDKNTHFIVYVVYDAHTGVFTIVARTSGFESKFTVVDFLSVVYGTENITSEKRSPLIKITRAHLTEDERGTMYRLLDLLKSERFSSHVLSLFKKYGNNLILSELLEFRKRTIDRHVLASTMRR